MSISVDELLAFAEALGNGTTECEWRSAASRAYYSAFHRGLEVAEACLAPNRYVSGAHERLTDRFKSHSIKGKALAYVLIDLKKTRTIADYKLGVPFRQTDATDFIPQCKSFIARVDGFLATETGNAAAGS